MSEIVRARVQEHLVRLRLGHVAERLDALLSEAARKDTTFLDFLDGLLREEVQSKQRKRVAVGIQIAHFPTVKTLEEYDFKFQPSIDAKLVRELATGRFVAQADNVLLFGPPGVGKTHLAIALGRAAVETGHSTLFVTATALLANLMRAQAEAKLGEQLAFYAKPKLLVVDELGYLPFEKNSAHLFFQLVTRRYERGSMLITTNQMVTQWGQVFGRPRLRPTWPQQALPPEAVLRKWHAKPQDGLPPTRRPGLRPRGAASGAHLSAAQCDCLPDCTPDRRALPPEAVRRKLCATPEDEALKPATKPSLAVRTMTMPGSLTLRAVPARRP